MKNYLKAVPYIRFFNFFKKPLSQPTVMTMASYYFPTKNAAKPIPSINAAAINIAV
jgi:hypothetical protein